MDAKQVITAADSNRTANGISCKTRLTHSIVSVFDAFFLRKLSMMQR
jgi:hypothetical protein